MTKEDGYKETKVCKCISCGTDVTVTKFASASKVMCDKCKTSGGKPNVNIIASTQVKVEPRAKYDGATKILPCTKCGKDVEVTKFASASKVICDECKGESGGYAQHGDVVMNPAINMKKLDRNIIPTLDEYKTTPALINNTALRNIRCPACGHEHMKILKVMDWNVLGLIIHYQCPKCRLLVSVSEQCKHQIKYKCDGEIFDYSGEEIYTNASALDGSRLSTSVLKLLNILKEHNIEVKKEDLPPYIYDETRPVPVGYRIPRDDVSIKLIDDLIKIFDKSERMGSLIDTPEGSRYIQISDTAAKLIASKLRDLFKDGV